MTKSKSRSAIAPNRALVRAAALKTPVAIPKEKRGLLAEALERGEATRDVVEDALVAYGRWLLNHVFEGDTSAALSDREDNAVWLELLRRAGGPTLRLSRRLLYVALRMAAYDKRIADETWRNLDVGRKELLLPLADERLLRQAAKHVTAMKLTQDATRAYVAEQRAQNGRTLGLRLTPGRLTSRLRAFREGLFTSDVRQHIERMGRDLSEDQRDALAKELAEISRGIEQLSRMLG